MSKDSLIKGTLILALAAFVARFLGVVQRVPLKRLLDDSGMATYGTANNIYLMLLVVATAGIPSALSKLISEKTALGRYDEANRIYEAAVRFAIVAGLAITALLYIAAPYYVQYVSNDPDATMAIRALAPALLLFPLIAMMRGYFQGRQMMSAGGISQIVEQILRVVTSIVLAAALLWMGFGHTWAVAGASFGGVMGSVGAFLVMLYFASKLRKQDRRGMQAAGRSAVRAGGAGRTDGSAVSASEDAASEAAQSGGAKRRVEPMSYRQIYRTIFRLSLPISIISLAVPVIYVIDSSLVIKLLQEQIGFDAAKETLGILIGRAQSIAGLPPILAIALSQSILPVISSAFARRDAEELNRQASLALRLSVLAGVPIIILLTVAARPINGFLFEDTLGTDIIVLLTVSTIFQIVMMTSGAILMGLGQIRAPMAYVFAGIAVKLIGTFLLAPWLGIYGIVLATFLCFAVTNQLNLYALRKTVRFRILGRRWLGLAASVAVLAAVGYALDKLAAAYINGWAGWLNYGLQSFVICAVVLALYPFLLAWTKVVTREDVDSFPASLQKLIRRGARLVRLRG